MERVDGTVKGGGWVGHSRSHVEKCKPSCWRFATKTSINPFLDVRPPRSSTNTRCDFDCFLISFPLLTRNPLASTRDQVRPRLTFTLDGCMRLRPCPHRRPLTPSTPDPVLVGAARQHPYLQTLVIQKARVPPVCPQHNDFHPLIPRRPQPMSVGPATTPSYFTLLHDIELLVVPSAASRTSIDAFNFNVV
ncbi:hypothetical protein GALMADRAFT_1209327 [Galerina marginata CBS 339.88]|uniref:Uncharacterized protein n=1 Tax=Galerina marginata (strain CBS 339.88) TaxID=685588 RepID=A0A067S860_GALM3|nr:hypothetical protein GALMADRAFT_1209327 [Galerina marginata CBS 339.88]